MYPGDKTTPEFTDFFPLVLSTFDYFRGPRNISISLYRDWNDPARANALVAFKSAWTEACAVPIKGSVLVREELRLLLAAAFICLMASSFEVTINPKNFAIIACSFASLGYGALSLLQFFISDWSATHRLDAHVVVLSTLALLFPALPRLNPKEIFGRSESDRG